MLHLNFVYKRIESEADEIKSTCDLALDNALSL